MQQINDSKIKSVQNLEGANQTAPSKSGTFMGFAILILIFLSLVILVFFIVRDDIKMGKQMQTNYEQKLNSPEMQKYREEEAKRQREEIRRRREMAKRKRLKQMGVETTANPMEKNDLLNAKLKESRARQEQEIKLEEEKNIQGFDYSAELAAYNAKVQEVQAEEARIKAEQEAKIKAEQERIAARERAEAERRAQIKAQQEKIKAEQAKAAKQAKLKSQTSQKTQKTEKKVLQTTKSNFGSSSSLQPK